MEATGLKTVRSDWTNAILVCRKCSKKLDGGFGPDGTRSLAKVLRREIKGGNGRKGALGVVEVQCLGICPKRAVTVVDTAAPGTWLLVPEGAPVATIVARLGLDRLEPDNDEFSVMATHP